MKKSNRITSLIMSVMMSISAVPMISNAEDYNYSEAIQPSVQPYTVDGDSVIFEGNKDFDFIVSGCSKFSTERTDESFTFKPTYTSTSFLISRVRLAEEIIDINYDIEDDDIPEDMPVGMPVIELHCHYFYPVIQNFAVTYNVNTGTQVEYLGERSYRSETNVDKIKSGDIAGFDYFEDYDTEKICNSGDYYALASCTVDHDMFLTYFDYGYESETRKDKSVFCLETPYGTYQETPYSPNDRVDLYIDRAGSYINVSGNAEITNTYYGPSCIGGDLMEKTGDIVAYTTIEPTSDGFVEIYCPDVFPMSSIILDVANGKFIPGYSTIGCVMPEKCDLNMDEYINISDAVIFQKYILGKTKLTSIQFNCADLNYDGSVDIFDMVLVRQKVIEDNYMGLIPEPVDTVQPLVN